MSTSETPEASPAVPQSDVLAEAKAEDLSELFSRDPESYSEQDEKALIAAFRAQRLKWEAAEAAGEHKRPKAAKADSTPLLKKAPKTADEMGL